LTTDTAAIIMAHRRYGTMMFSYDTIREMNETELGIYKYITANIDKIPFMTIRELSDTVQVSTSTVLMFCNTAGFEKYAEFKEAVTKDIPPDSVAVGNPCRVIRKINGAAK
jgi:DNA-binding MurR/RpiR family transcriptional regulator